ncbi:MAG: SDR family NAD(P)-dependent oxidoreductase, partial [Chloroflexi bacterium]|nr:SDR family NAD(P)-dependent oxidoreductase [Chloroflexota bacterium]
MPLAGKVVVVTGGSRGIGKGIAIELARGGANVVIAGRTETPEQGPAPGTIWQTLEEITALHAAKAIAMRCDVTKEDEVANLMQRAASAFGHINALVNNAGAAFRPGTLRDIPLSRWYE